MSTEPERPRRLAGGPLLAMTALVGVGKRLGLSKAVTRIALKQILSEKIRKRAFAGYVPAEHDVFVATFGKSGTNWMMQIAQQIAHRGEAEFRHIHDVVAWPDAPTPVPASLADLGPRDASPTGLRVIKTHLETEYVPYAEKAKYLTILRDPKEVIVSAYYFLGGILGVLSHLSFDDWFALNAGSDTMLTGWAHHAASYWAWRDRPNVFVRSYGEVQRDARGTIEEVAAIMRVDLSEAQLERVMERSSFAYMKSHESQFAPPRRPFSKEEDRPKMVRRGKSGASEELMSRSQQVEVDRLCQSELRRIGSDLPYAELFDVVTDAETA